MDCVTSTDENHRKELASLLTLKFQMFNKNTHLQPKQEKQPKKSLGNAAQK